MDMKTPKRPVCLIARREIQDHLQSQRFYICTAALAVLVGFSIFVMFQDYVLRMENYAVLQERARPRPGEVGLMAVVRPRALSIFAKGLEETLDRGYTAISFLGIEAHQRQTSVRSLFSLFPTPDLLHVIKVFLSLLAVVFSYNVVSGDRENGTLKLLLSSSASRAQILVGKILGVLSVVLVPFLAFFLAGLTVLYTSGRVALGAQDLQKVGLMLLATALYVFIFTCLGTLLSSLCRSPITSLVTLLFLWGGVVLVYPNLGNLLAEQLVEVPSASTQEAVRLSAFARNRFLAIHAHGSDSGGSLADFDAFYKNFLESQRLKLEELIRTSKKICEVSPAGTLTFILTDLASTGVGEQMRLARQLQAFEVENSAFLTDQISGQTGHSPTVFNFEPEGTETILQQGVLLDLGILALVGLLLLSASGVAFLKLDPR
ncbi:MAG: ABC transporter permease [Acidobacteriota bacterium]